MPDSKDAPPLPWGTLGTGWIAERFVASLQTHTRQQAVATGSRARSTARDFAHRFDVVRQLLADGVPGEVQSVIADHGDWFPPTQRIFRHDLAGGPLLDPGTFLDAIRRQIGVTYLEESAPGVPT